METGDLITKLSSQAQPVKMLSKPAILIRNLLLVLVVYAAIAQSVIGLRLDLAVQFTRPLFVAEVVLMFLFLVVSTACAVFSMYPDLYQKSRLLKIPYIILSLLFVIFVAQFFVEADPKMMLPETFHKMECTICIMFLALFPSVIIFAILQNGATVMPLQAGAFTVLSASALGYLILRFQEPNDVIIHNLVWHLLPMIFFAFVGALIGKFLLKW